MPAMNSITNTGTGLPADAQPQTEGLPQFKYMPPVLTTMLAGIFILLCAAALGFFGILNTLTGINRVMEGEPNASLFSAGLCGMFTLVALVGTVYFTWATVKGVRDLMTPPYYTRGTVLSRREQDREIMGRKANNWLLMQPHYSGPDLQTACAINDDQRAASVDRAAIFNPRVTPLPKMTRADRQDDQLRRSLGAAPRSEGYLSADRISASTQPVTTSPPAEDRSPLPHVVFRIDFASKARLTPDEEVLVAHSRFLEHVYYVARLKDGKWEAYRNRNLI